ncbi:MAG: hypothetical protein II984_05550 [Clostridia bacterium]|nr:hypothetical protein [Clostridia bacterium]
MNEETKTRIKSVIILLIIFLIVLNIYFYFSKTYVSAQDNINDENILTIKYSEILKESDSFSNQISLYLIDEPAEKDSRTYELLGVILIFSSLVFLLLGLISFSKNEKFGFIIAGVLSSCIGSGCLYIIVNIAEKTIRESLLGTIESIFGKGSIIVINTSADTFATLDILVGVIICALIAYYHYKNTVTVKSDQTQE